ncbi:MAG: DUF1570 domain-containing protein [Fimbriiglobus sp.]
MTRVLPAVLILVLACPVLAADPVGPSAAWPSDELTLTNGAALRGCLLDEFPQGVRFQVVRRAAGRPTVTLTMWFARNEVAGVKKIPDADRAALREKLAALDPVGTSERARMDALELLPAEWLGKPGAARRYTSDRFTLVSGAPDEVTRRAAVRLEQIDTAFARFLPPRVRTGDVTTVVLAGTLDDYRTAVGPAAGPILNPAVYEPARNRIVCGSDLGRLGAELARRRIGHVQQIAGLDRYEAEVRRLYKNQKDELARFLDGVVRERKKVSAAERANDAVFDAATARLFALLYHEAFHAYVATFVYPPLSAADVRAGRGTGELPRWLNEGLAQIFETAVLEAGELRVGHADPGRLTRAQSLLSGKTPGGLAPLAELLRAGKDAFVTAHTADRGGSDRAYLTAWAVTSYLTFDRRVVGGKPFDAYLTAVNGGGDPVAAFEKLVGTDVPAFEAGFRAYLTALRPDGSTGPRP